MIGTYLLNKNELKFKYKYIKKFGQNTDVYRVCIYFTKANIFLKKIFQTIFFLKTKPSCHKM